MKERAGWNSISSKHYNRGLILQLIATGECRTRIELTRRTGLAKMTVTNIVAEFIEKKILVECEEELTEVCGRNPIRLAVSEDAPKLIGLLIFRDRIETVLCDLTMKILDRKKRTFETLNERTMMETACELIDELLEKEQNVAGIGASVIGPVDVNRGMLLNPFRFFGIKNVPILELLRERYTLPVYFDHDNTNAALAEKRYGAGKDAQDFIFLGVSNGIGSGIICGGVPYHSARGIETEIGHVSIDYNGPLCPCGNRGCLEAYASAFVLERQLREATGLERDYSYFCGESEDGRVKKILEDSIRKIAAGLVSTINILQPELVVIGHECMDWKEEYALLLEDLINQNKAAQDGRRILVRKAYFRKDSMLVGSAANVAEHVFRGELQL